MAAELVDRRKVPAFVKLIGKLDFFIRKIVDEQIYRWELNRFSYSSCIQTLFNKITKCIMPTMGCLIREGMHGYM